MGLNKLNPTKSNKNFIEYRDTDDRSQMGTEKISRVPKFETEEHSKFLANFTDLLILNHIETKEDKEKLQIVQLFPALAMPNINKDEINLDLNFDMGGEPSPKEEKERRDSREKHHKRSRSRSNSDRRKRRRRDHSDSSDSRERRHNKRRSDRDKYHESSRKDPSKENKENKENKEKDERRRSRHRERSRSKSDDRRRNRTQGFDREENFERFIGNIYQGEVKTVKNFGAFIACREFGRKQGLCHVSQMKTEGRLRDANEMVKTGDIVFVKVISYVDNKLSLSMKEADQVKGRDLHPANTLDLKSKGTSDNLDDDRAHNRINPVKPLLKGGYKFGNITGIKLDEDEDRKNKPKRLASPDLWERSRLEGAQVLDANDELNIEGRVAEDLAELDEEELEIEINEEHAPFLQFNVTKTGVSLSPIRIAKNPDGSLHRAAMKQGQLARDRKEKTNQEEKEKRKKASSDIEGVGNINNQSNSGMAGTSSFFNKDKDMPEWKVKQANRNRETKHRPIKTIDEQRRSLPIYRLKKQLMDAINEHQILVVIGETGSGKTTQMTQYLVEMGYARKGRIGCTQPRRVAAMSVAKRVSEEYGCRLGQEVGYCIRFEDYTSPSTVIKYMTDGMLLREALLDLELNQYSVIMLDEAHERTIDTDVLFGLLKTAVLKRKDLKIIVTSATLDAEKFSEYFYDWPIFKIPGSMYPVKVMFSKTPPTDYLEDAISTVEQIHLHEPKGDILVFLTGQEEIDTACEQISQRMKALGDEVPPLIVLSLYSAKPTDQQTEIFDPAPEGTRKCIVATNIAEASITIDGIYYVVDSGFSKMKVYNPKLGMDNLEIAPISQASARQRMGRAGRTGPGKWYRLYTEDQFNNEMLPTTIPEIQRTNCANKVLILKAMGINDLINFDFMDPPPVQTLIAAMEQLYNLSALDDEGLLTKLGRLMAEFPLEPQLSKMLLTSVDLSCTDEIITIVAMLSVPNFFHRPREKQQIADQKRAKFFQPDGDHLTLLTIYESWKQHGFSVEWWFDNFIQARGLKRAQDVRKQLITIMEKYKLQVSSCRGDYKKVRKAITSGFFVHAARKDQQEGYKTVADSHSVYIHPGSALFNKNPDWVVYHELVMTSKEYMRNVCAIDSKWLLEVAPNYFKTSDKNTISKRKRQEKIQPLFNKYEDPDAWRMSRRKE